MQIRPMQLEDFEYTKWLDPAGVPCYTWMITELNHEWIILGIAIGTEGI